MSKHEKAAHVAVITGTAGLLTVSFAKPEPPTENSIAGLIFLCIFLCGIIRLLFLTCIDET
jgi:hypothetical protein